MEVEKRVQAGWRNWQRLSGVICDQKLSAKRKGKVYKVAVRPAMTCGAKTGAIKKAQEKKLNTIKMRTLRWACGQTPLDHVENREIRGRTKVTEMHRKFQEKRLGW